MVSLYDMMLQEPKFAHLSTSIPTLDAKLMSKTWNGIYDFQSVPNCSGSYSVVGSIIVSHLRQKPENRVIVVETLHPFPWHNVVCQDGFQDSWAEDKLVGYTTDTFAKLFALFMSEKLNGPRGTTMVIVNNFHELVELYKLEISAAYEETLLKFQVATNSALINNIEKRKVEGSHTKLPEIPPQSALLRENPTLKFQAHLSILASMISQFTYKNDLICILMGYLTTKYQNYRPKPLQMGSDLLIPSSASSNTPSSSTRPISGYGNGRVVLAASLGGNYTPPNSASASAPPKNSTSSVNSTLDSFITTRLIFYKDWYHKSEHFKENHPPSSQYQRRIIGSSQLKMVYAVKVIHLHQADNESSPVYFDYDNGYYCDFDDSDESQPNYKRTIKVIDLSRFSDDGKEPANFPLTAPTQDNDTIFTTPQSEFPRAEETISARMDDGEKLLPSSPDLTESQIKVFLPSTDSSHNNQTSQPEAALPQIYRVTDDLNEVQEQSDGDEQDLVIGASDDDMMGSLLLNRNDTHSK